MINVQLEFHILLRCKFGVSCLKLVFLETKVEK